MPIVRETYMTVIKNSLGTKLFKNFYAFVDGTKMDIMNDGRLSCAWFVSSILTLFSLIKNPHGTVTGTIKDIEESGWERVDTPNIGCLLVWEETTSGMEKGHRHIGFFIGNDIAISNSSEHGFPIEHHWTFGAETEASYRRVQAMYWHKRLDE
jgi:hypothetical protein